MHGFHAECGQSHKWLKITLLLNQYCAQTKTNGGKCLMTKFVVIVTI